MAVAVAVLATVSRDVKMMEVASRGGGGGGGGGVLRLFCVGGVCATRWRGGNRIGRAGGGGGGEAWCRRRGVRVPRLAVSRDMQMMKAASSAWRCVAVAVAVAMAVQWRSWRWRAGMCRQQSQRRQWWRRRQ